MLHGIIILIICEALHRTERLDHVRHPWNLQSLSEYEALLNILFENEKKNNTNVFG